MINRIFLLLRLVLKSEHDRIANEAYDLGFAARGRQDVETIQRLTQALEQCRDKAKGLAGR